MTANGQEKTLVQLLQENDISLDVLGDEKNLGFLNQRERLIHLLKSGQITERRIEALSKVLPSANDALKSVSKDARDSQIASIEAIKSEHSDVYKIILKIVEDAQSDELRKEALETVERISASNNATHSAVAKDNNNTFRYVAGVIFCGLLLVAGGAAAKALSSR